MNWRIEFEEEAGNPCLAYCRVDDNCYGTCEIDGIDCRGLGNPGCPAVRVEDDK